MLDTKVNPSAATAMERFAEEGGEKERVHDSSVDYKGRIPRRSATGGWRASLFIIGRSDLPSDDLPCFLIVCDLR